MQTHTGAVALIVSTVRGRNRPCLRARLGRRAAALLLPFLMVACQSFGKRDCDDCQKVLEPKVLHKPTMHAAASDLDHLERHIDWHGSVTAAVPAVWGQARLQQYREDFEGQMKDELGGFKDSLQGSLARSDQAFLLNATAISAALETPVRGFRTQTVPAGRFLGRNSDGTPKDPAVKDNILVIDKPQTILIPPANPPQTLPTTPTGVGGVIAGGDKTGKAPNAESIDVFIDRATALKFTNEFRGLQKDEKLKLSLEPERYLEQKKRYLDLLAQIRRTNEGDDTADAPGYSLQLFRIPVSVLPGKRTDVGFGAEITMSLAPVLGDDLLPNTFRNLVINDLVHQLGFPITQALDPNRDPENYKYLKELLTRDTQKVLTTLALISDYLVAGEGKQADAVYKALPIETRKAIRGAVDCDDQATLDSLSDHTRDKPRRPLNATRDGLAFGLEDGAGAPAVVFRPNLASFLTEKRSEINDGKVTQPRSVRQSMAVGLGSLVPQFAPGTNARVALPTSQLLDVYGTVYALEIAPGARDAFGKQAVAREYVHLPEVQGYLKEELNAAYDLLNNPLNSELWNLCQPTLVHLVRTQAYDQLDEKRREFRRAVERLAQSGPDKLNRRDPAQLSRSAAFAWAILIDAALLNDKLCGEMKAQATRGGCAAPASDWLPLYLPKPAPAECQAFNDYVKARWPIQVFALDPSIQEQNLADRLATRRELQLSLSLAFAHGYLSFNQLSRYARRLEAEYETIDVNRTAIGFNHGPVTFGWRFYPRYQTPDTPSNVELVGRDLLYGGPNKSQLLRQRRLEPGPRECVALVIMPSFVSGVRVESTSNFFAVANPKHKVFDHTDGLRLGRTVKALTTVGLSDAHCYRDGDAERLVARARQLEARLPMQTNTFAVPTEGTLGGFELFNTSTKSLAPELDGFYGAPGVDFRKTTTLFLVGDHFSPLRTKVIVGNTAPIEVSLLSRQVARVVVPPGTVTVKGGKHVSVHIATPYGVSRELLVPIADSATAEPDGYYLTTNSKLVLDLSGTSAAGDKVTVAVGGRTGPVSIRPKFASGQNPTTVRVSIPGQTVAVDVAIGANGTYTLSQENMAALFDPWAVRFVPASKQFGSVAEAVLLVPTGLRIQVTPVSADSNARPATVSVFDLLPVTAQVKK